MITNSNLNIFKENLGNISDFRTDEKYHTLILDPKKNSNYTLNFFKNIYEPFLVYEENFDHLNETVVRCMRRSPLVMRDDWKRDLMRIPRNQNNIHI